MKTYEAFNKIFDANDSLRKQTIDIFMEKIKDCITVFKAGEPLPNPDEEDYIFEFEFDPVNYEKLFNAIEQFLEQDYTGQITIEKMEVK